jgi:hypothetical protein
MPLGIPRIFLRNSNLPPEAVDDEYTTTVGQCISFNPLLNDKDPDVFPSKQLIVKTFDAISTGNNNITLSADNKNMAYCPAMGYHGEDTFTYKCYDGMLESNTATVTVAVICLPPIISPKVLNFNENNDYVIKIFNPSFDSANVYFTDGKPDRDINPIPQTVKIKTGSVSVAGTGFSLITSNDDSIQLRCASVIGTVASAISVTYTLINACGLETTATINGYIDPSTRRRFVFDFDYLVLTYEFNDGIDLDTRTKLVSPDIGMNNYLGWGQGSSSSNGGKIILQWGGDNRGTGQESCIFYTRTLLERFPTTTDLTIDCRAMWYGSRGTLVKIKAYLAKGGTVYKSGYTFGVNRPDNTQIVASFQKIITTESQDENNRGERVATLMYNIPTVTGIFNSADTTTP